MNITTTPVLRVVLVGMLLCMAAVSELHAQAAPFEWEIRPDRIDSRFLDKWDNRYMPRVEAPDNDGIKRVRVIYLVPSDKEPRNDYVNALASAITSLQTFYGAQMGGEYRFRLNTPVVEVYRMPHNSSWYSTNRIGSDQSQYYWYNTLNDGFTATGGSFNDPNNRWLFYLDADQSCGQATGGTSGVALMPANDLRGLTNQANIPPCAGDSPDTFGRSRWIGGAGHELGHAFNLPHPAGCGSSGPNYGCVGGSTAANSLMWVGYAYYPNTYLLPENTASLSTTGFFYQSTGSKSFDFDGDGKSDISAYRPTGSSGGQWWWMNSSSNTASAASFGSATDVIVPADYTGDGKTDMAFFRPSTGQWFVLRSEDGSFYSFPFGMAGDVPMPADYTGDGKADAAVYRPSSGTWFILRSSDSGVTISQFGAAGDQPVAGDYDGDGKADIAVFRPNGAAGAEWWIQRSTGGIFAATFGTSTDKAVPGDWTGDGKTDVAFFRPSNGTWYVLRSEDGSYYSFPFGISTDVPAPGDYDGDGKMDAAVYRSSTSTWYINKSSGGVTITSFGAAGDQAVPGAFVR